MTTFFDILPFLIITFSIAVVACRNPVYSVLCLILVFSFSALLLLSMGVEFLAFILLIVYAGAISILFLFIVLLLNIKPETSSWKFNYTELSLLTVIFFKASVLILNPAYILDVLQSSFSNLHYWDNSIRLCNIALTVVSDIYIYSLTLYTHYFLFTVLAGIILLLAMVGAITLTKK